MKKTNRTTKVIATVMAIIIAVSALSVCTAISTSALSVAGTAQAHASQKMEQAAPTTTPLNTTAKAYVFTCKGKTSYGYDYDYTATNKNVKVKCAYNFKSHTYKFTFTGAAKGTTKMIFKYKTSNKTWVKVPMTFKVDAQKNIMRVA